MQRSRLALAAVTIVALAAAVPVAGSIDFTAEQFEHVTGNRDLALFHSLLQLAQIKERIDVGSTVSAGRQPGCESRRFTPQPREWLCAPPHPTPIALLGAIQDCCRFLLQTQRRGRGSTRTPWTADLGGV